MTTNTSAKATLHQRAMHEFKELAIISAYLYVTIGAVILMKAAVLRTDGVEFIPWGIAIVKAVVLGKFVLLGNMVHVGGRDISGPLIWPTLRRAFAILVLLIVLTIIEEAVVGLFHHRSIAASLGELFGARLEETLAGYLIMLLVLIPFFAFRVLSEALGEGRLERMFFVERRPSSDRPGRSGQPMRYRDVEQELICSPTAPSVSSCSLRSRTLRAAAGGALRASLTFAARDELGERRSGRRDGRIDRTTGRLAGSAGGEVGCEWPAVLGDAVDGVQQLAHGGNEGELGRLAGGTQAFVEGAQPRVAAHGAKHRHPQRHAQTRIAEWRDGGADRGALAGLAQPRHHTDIGGEGCGTGEVGWIADCGDDACNRLRADAVDGEQQLADRMRVEQVLDVVLDLGEAASPQIQILADVTRLQRIGGTVVVADRTLGGIDELAGEFVADQMTPVVAQSGQPGRRGASEGVRGGIFGQQTGGEHAVEAADVAGELGEAEIDQAMQLADPIAEILPQPVAMADELAQGLGRLVVQPSWCGPLLECQTREAGGVDRVGLGAFETGILEAPGEQRVEQRDLVSQAAVSAANRFFQ